MYRENAAENAAMRSIRVPPRIPTCPGEEGHNRTLISPEAHLCVGIRQGEHASADHRRAECEGRGDHSTRPYGRNDKVFCESLW